MSPVGGGHARDLPHGRQFPPCAGDRPSQDGGGGGSVKDLTVPLRPTRPLLARAIDLSYESLVPSDAKSALNRCQRAIGKAATTFALAQAKHVQKCWDLRLARKHAGVCPDATAPAKSPAQKAAAAIAKAERKKIAAICKSCGGADKRCDDAVIALDGGTVPGSGNGDDLTPAAIGFPPTCPAVQLPGGAFCEQPVGSLAALVECVDCMGAFTVTCAERVSVPELAVYPCECR